MILSVLTEGPLYGYLIQKKLRDSSGNMVRMQAGTLYPILHRLEVAGAIFARWDSSTGRDRKWYELTDKGKRLLNEQAAEWHQYADCIRRLLDGVLNEPRPLGSANPATAADHEVA